MLLEVHRAQGLLQVGPTAAGSWAVAITHWLDLFNGIQVHRSVGSCNALFSGLLESANRPFVHKESAQDKNAPLPLLQLLCQVLPTLGPKAAEVVRAQPLCFELMGLLCRCPRPQSCPNESGHSFLPAALMSNVYQVCKFLNTLFGSELFDRVEVSSLLLRGGRSKRSAVSVLVDACSDGGGKRRKHAGSRTGVEDADDDVVVESIHPAVNANADYLPQSRSVGEAGGGSGSTAVASVYRTTPDQRQVKTQISFLYYYYY